MWKGDGEMGRMKDGKDSSILFYLLIPVDGVITRLIFPFQSSLEEFLGMLPEVGNAVFLTVS